MAYDGLQYNDDSSLLLVFVRKFGCDSASHTIRDHRHNGICENFGNGDIAGDDLE